MNHRPLLRWILVNQLGHPVPPPAAASIGPVAGINPLTVGLRSATPASVSGWFRHPLAPAAPLAPPESPAAANSPPCRAAGYLRHYRRLPVPRRCPTAAFPPARK